MGIRFSLWPVVGLVTLLTGCAAMTQALSGAQKPSASVQGARLTDLSLQAAALVFDVKVDNPYEFDLPITSIDYALAARSAQFLAGRAELSGTVPAGGSRVIQAPANVVFTDLLDAVSGVRLGQVVPYRADLGISADAPGVGPLRLPVSHSGQLPIPNVPRVELAGIQWEEVSLQSASATIDLKLTNTNEFPVNLARLAYALDLEGTEVFAGETARPLALSAGQTGRLQIPVRASAARLGAALLNMARKASGSYSLTGTTEVTTPFGPLTLPIERTGTTSMSR